MLISIPCHIFCSGKRLPIPAARPYLSVYSKWPPRVLNGKFLYSPGRRVVKVRSKYDNITLILSLTVT